MQIKVEDSGSYCEYYQCPVTHPQNPNQAAPYIANCEDIIQALGLTFDEGCEFKSIWRRGRGRQGFVKAESTPLRDAVKAVHYAMRIMHLEQRREDAQRPSSPATPAWATHTITDPQLEETVYVRRHESGLYYERLGNTGLVEEIYNMYNSDLDTAKAIK